MNKHATMLIWNRAHDGGYEAELNGFRLSVRWTPADEQHPRGFVWSIVTPSGAKLAAHESDEEMEVAMAHAEEIAAGEARPEPTLD